MDKVLNVGDKIPFFKTKDMDGHAITTQDMIGAPLVLFFYPKDETPGCTKQVCSIRDSIDQFKQNDVLIVGISPDSNDSHKKFIKNHQLNFPLLSDEGFELCHKFGVVKEKIVEGKKFIGIQRTTFFIDRDGVIQWIERPVNVEGHTERLSAAVQEYLKK